MREDRRKHVRYLLSTKAFLEHNGQMVVGTTHDASSGGFYFLGPANIPVGAAVHGAVMIRTCVWDVRCHCVRVNKGGCALRIERIHVVRGFQTPEQLVA